MSSSHIDDSRRSPEVAALPAEWSADSIRRNGKGGVPQTGDNAGEADRVSDWRRPLRLSSLIGR